MRGGAKVLKESGGLITFYPGPCKVGSYLRGGWGGGGLGRGNTTAKNRVRSSLILKTYLKCSQNADSLSGKENKTRMKA